LLCHVKAELNAKYGDDIVQLDKPIPVHLLGNITGNNFSNLYDDLAPEGVIVDRDNDLTEKLKSSNYTEVDLVRVADKFHASLGFAPFDELFYKESSFAKPETYDVQCNTGHWWIYGDNQARIAHCFNINAFDFYDNHQGLGRILYQKYAAPKSPSADRVAPTSFAFGFMKALKLSITPDYLKKMGLLDKLPSTSEELSHLMKLAFEEVAAIPFYIAVDKWRWAVASGEISPDNYNQTWWDLIKQYQGIAPVYPRSEKYFDPGTIAAVINNRDLSVAAFDSILKFQFHKILCDASGNIELLSHCSIYNSKEAGNKLKELFKMGNSKPWSESLATWTGQSTLDASALLEYFSPLQTYLDEQKKDRICS
jgi:peptidyl-dipeptidase A